MNGVSWNYYNSELCDKINDKYLLPIGEGDNMATQIVTAINKLIYKWYNDGDVFDNTYYLDGWWNDISSYANWLAKYVDGAFEILNRIKIITSESEYEFLLKDLYDKFFDEKLLANYEQREKVGSVYKCKGEFVYEEYNEDEDDEW